MENKFIYCSHCGAQNSSDSTYCYNCGEKLLKLDENNINQTTSSYKQDYNYKNNTKSSKTYKSSSNSLGSVAFVFCLLRTILLSWTIVLLIINIFLTIKVYNHVYKGEELTTGTKVCVLLFTSIIAGVLLLCEQDN